jgi:DNA-binding protein H-NS
MSNFIKVLLNIRSLKAVARELTIEQLEDGLSKLTTVIDELRSQKQAEQRSNEERARKIAEYKALMAADGIDASELLGNVEAKSISTRAPRPPKYAYLDDNGQQQTWTGQGRQPRPIRKAIESGSKKLEDFLIND